MWRNVSLKPAQPAGCLSATSEHSTTIQHDDTTPTVAHDSHLGILGAVKRAPTRREQLGLGIVRVSLSHEHSSGLSGSFK
jgi:hypothetical protein